MKARIRRLVLVILWRAVRRRVQQDNPYVIGVTGSVGKTSTKEAIATLLEQTGKPVVKTAGNMATDTGIPLSLLGFTDRAKTMGRWMTVLRRALFPHFPTFTERPYYVLELSSDALGDLQCLVKHFPLHVLVYTTGGNAHMEQYQNEDSVLEELASILPSLQTDGYVVLNADDAPLAKLKITAPVCRYGIKTRAELDVRASILARHGTGIQASFRFGKGNMSGGLDGLKRNTAAQSMEVTVQVVGEQQLYSVLAAVTVARREGLTEKQIAKGVEGYQIPAGRGRIIEGQRGVSIVDDTANSSPEAVIAGMTMLRPFAGTRRTVAILGTMNELGDYALRSHQEIAAAAASRIDFLVAVGQYNQEMLAAAQKAGMQPQRMIGFPTPEHVIKQLEQIVQKKDVVYLKASQNGMRLEQIVYRLMLHPEKAAELLVRQGPEWKE